MGLQEELQRQQQAGASGPIQQMYDNMRTSQLAGLEEDYNKERSALLASRDQIGTVYQGQANDLAAQYERNRRTLNAQAAASGLNTGAGSQQNLALQGSWAKNYGALRRQQAADVAEADRGLTDLERAYDAKRRQTAAELDWRKQQAEMDQQRYDQEWDYKKAQDLLEQEQAERQRLLQQAQTLASYGDFSVYAQLYGQAAADNMRAVWVANNPQLAYNTGAISADEYYRMTGQYPANYSVGGGWSGYTIKPGGEPDKTSGGTVPTTVVKPGVGPHPDEAATLGQNLYNEYLRSRGALGSGGSAGKRLDVTQ